MRYVLSLGTNIGNRKNNLLSAVKSLELIPETKVLDCSSIYETEPVGYAQQDDFYNIALLLESKFEPNEMLGLCLGIESGFGRKRGILNGPRILDIDLLLAEGVKLETKNLSVPHPRIRERRFVLQPMLDLFPNGTAFDYEFASYIDKIEGQAVVQAEPPENYYIED